MNFLPAFISRGACRFECKPLFYMARDGCDNVVSMLLDLRADIEAKSRCFRLWSIFERMCDAIV
jgi:hypothetical protein